MVAVLLTVASSFMMCPRCVLRCLLLDDIAHEGNVANALVCSVAELGSSREAPAMPFLMDEMWLARAW